MPPGLEPTIDYIKRLAKWAFAFTKSRAMLWWHSKGKWWKVPIFMLLWVAQFVGIGGADTFIHGGLVWLREEKLMKTMWLIGFLTSFFYCLYWWNQDEKRQRRGRGGIGFVWMPWLVLFAMSFIFLFRDIPSIKQKGFLPSHDNASYRQVIHDRRHSDYQMVDTGRECYKAGEYAYTVICFEIAKNKMHAQLNQYWPFYIGALLEVGRDDDAETEKTELMFAVAGNHTNDAFNVQNIMYQVLINIDEAKVNLPKEDKEYLGRIADQIQPYYDRFFAPKPEPQSDQGTSGLIK